MHTRVAASPSSSFLPALLLSHLALPLPCFGTGNKIMNEGQHMSIRNSWMVGQSDQKQTVLVELDNFKNVENNNDHVLILFLGIGHGKKTSSISFNSYKSPILQMREWRPWGSSFPASQCQYQSLKPRVLGSEVHPSTPVSEHKRRSPCPVGQAGHLSLVHGT